MKITVIFYKYKLTYNIIYNIILIYLRKVILYIAMSLEGYIADNKGKVNWLYNFNTNEIFENCNNSIKNIDTIIMRYNT